MCSFWEIIFIGPGVLNLTHGVRTCDDLSTPNRWGTFEVFSGCLLAEAIALVDNEDCGATLRLAGEAYAMVPAAIRQVARS